MQLVLKWHALNSYRGISLCVMSERFGSVVYIIVILTGLLICQCQNRGVARVGGLFLGPLDAIPKL